MEHLGEGRGGVAWNVTFQTCAHPASAQTSVVSDRDVWTRACADAAARSPELRPAPAGLTHSSIGRKKFKCAQLKLFTFTGWVGRKGGDLQGKAQVNCGNPGLLVFLRTEEQGTLLVDNPNK